MFTDKRRVFSLPDEQAAVNSMQRRSGEELSAESLRSTDRQRLKRQQRRGKSSNPSTCYYSTLPPKCQYTHTYTHIAKEPLTRPERRTKSGSFVVRVSLPLFLNGAPRVAQRTLTAPIKEKGTAMRRPLLLTVRGAVPLMRSGEPPKNLCAALRRRCLASSGLKGSFLHSGCSFSHGMVS